MSGSGFHAPGLRRERDPKEHSLGVDVSCGTGPPGPAGWERIAPAEDTPEGTITFRLASWSKFFDFLEAEVFDPSITSKHTYIWRGQRRSDWGLQSSLDRLFGKLKLPTTKKQLDDHLDSFKYATRGRRGPSQLTFWHEVPEINPRGNNPALLLENEWWALGQHFGLATPLLDWTRSPLAAAYFAFE